VTFEQELEQLINRHSIENAADTPDWLLTQYISGCLAVFARTIKERDRYYHLTGLPCSPMIEPRAEL
jgi:hypothetical protein